MAAYLTAVRSLYLIVAAVIVAFVLILLLRPGLESYVAAGVTLVCFAIALPLGTLLGIAQARARGRNQTGVTGRLTTVWDRGGVRIQADNFARAIPWQELRRLRRRGEFVVLQLTPWQNLTSPWVVGLPADFVPPQAFQQPLGKAARYPTLTAPPAEPAGFVDQNEARPTDWR